MTETELKEIVNLDDRIQSKLRQLEELRETITSIKGIDYSKDKIQTSPSNALENSVIRLIELEEEIAEDINTLVSKRQSARERINEIGGVYGVILEMRYLENKGFQEIAYRLSYSLVHIHRLHRVALIRISKDDSKCY